MRGSVILIALVGLVFTAAALLQPKPAAIAAPRVTTSSWASIMMVTAMGFCNPDPRCKFEDFVTVFVDGKVSHIHYGNTNQGECPSFRVHDHQMFDKFQIQAYSGTGSITRPQVLKRGDPEVDRVCDADIFW